MASCSWKLGCVIYWGVILCSIVILITLQIESDQVIPTDAYISCAILVKGNFVIILLYALVALAFAKVRVTSKLMPITVFVMSLGLLVLSPYTLFYVETIKFPKIEEALDILAKRFTNDRTIMNQIQSEHKCCGLRNFTDWFMISQYNSTRGTSSSKRTGNSISLNVLRSSCCKVKGTCQSVESTTSTDSNDSDADLDQEIRILEDHLFSQGCYAVVKESFVQGYKAFRSFSTVALILVIVTTATFTFMWWRKTAAAFPEPRCWPAPPLTVQHVVCEPTQGLLMAYVSPFSASAMEQNKDEAEYSMTRDCENNNNDDIDSNGNANPDKNEDDGGGTGIYIVDASVITSDQVCTK